VVQDNEFATWNAYGNQYWPAEYFIDAGGRVRYAHFGEGEYERKEQVIRELLTEAGRAPGAGGPQPDGVAASDGVSTPVSYLGSARADRFSNGLILPGVHDFGKLEPAQRDGLSYGGRWSIAADYATSRGGELELRFGAKRVYLVLGSPGRNREVRLTLDGKEIAPGDAGRDVSGSEVRVADERLYELLDLSEPGRHTLRLSPEAGVQAYAFTFG
jgi:hypothetical protein